MIIAPVFDEQELDISRRFMAHLKKVSVPFLDFTHLYDANEPQYTVAEEDAHNSGLANRLIAAELVKELGIGEHHAPLAANARDDRATPSAPGTKAASTQRMK